MTEQARLNVDYNGNIYCLTVSDGAVTVQRQGGGPQHIYKFGADHVLSAHEIYSADSQLWNYAAIHSVIAAYEDDVAKETKTSKAPGRKKGPAPLAGGESLEDAVTELPLWKIYWQARRNGKFLRAGLINIRASSALEAQEAMRELRSEMLPMLGPGAELTFNGGFLGEDNAAQPGLL